MSTNKANNIAAVLQGVEALKKFSFQEKPLPELKKGYALVRIQSVGICGSDVHYWKHGKCGPFEVNGPIILGHESSGLVVALGEGVSHLKVGDRVAIEPGIPCAQCVNCRNGSYNLCPDVVFHATPPYDGTLTKFILHRGDFLYKLPSHVSYEEGALIEPLSVGVQAAKRGAIKAGDHVLITGAGPIGLVCMMVARAQGATKIILVDLSPSRLETAKSLGADAVFKADDPEILAKLSQFAPITQTLECSGADSALVLAIRATNNGGKVVSIGRGSKPLQNIPLFEAMDREVDILGSFRYAGTWPRALELISSGQVNVKPLVTHRFPLERAQDAFTLSDSGADGAIKVMIKVTPDDASPSKL